MAVLHIFTAAFAVLAQPMGALAAVSALSCPQDIDVAGEDPGNWTHYGGWSQFLTCNEKPRLFKLPTSNISYGETSGEASGFSACTSLRGEIMSTLRVPWNETLADQEEHSGDIQVSWSVPSNDTIPGQAASVLLEISAYIATNALEDEDSPDAVFGHYGNTSVGVYIGEHVNHAAAVYTVLQKAIGRIRSEGVGESLVFQSCEPGEPQRTIGIFAETSGGQPGLETVRQAVDSWAQGDCAPALNNSAVIAGVKIWATRGEDMGSTTASSSSNATETTIQSVSSNSTSLKSGSATNALRRRAPPTKNGDGSCVSHVVKKGETCDSIAKANDIEVGDITDFNKDKTWGFEKCDGMAYDIAICLSEGDPPLPPPQDDVQCGPQVPGTKMPTDGTSIANLNPCPLNVCCSQFGFCGTTDEFCEKTGDVLGASGCLSNCERGITNNRETPSEFIKIGYFEAWNKNRDCLHMSVDEIDTSRFTHIHFAFGKVTPEFAIDMGGDIEEPFQDFVKLKGVKRIVSFGGWADSTEPGKFQTFRDAVDGGRNRTIFAENLVALVKEHDLDGIDVDWEYPAAPDIPGIPRGDPIDGDNYYALLTLLRVLLPAGKSLSIAAPASYWYLKGIPINDIAKELDYIVYMTYDLHGQWDTDGEHSQSGCANGDCLRSHVNYTETIDSLSMITRAGVPAAKVIVGVVSYGRSFLMAEAGCTGPMCNYLGDKTSSPAQAGVCTGEGGYIANAEIEMVMKTSANVEEWYDDDTMTDYLVYDDVQWVAYMKDDTKATRTSIYRSLNFGGVTDWAIDLESFGRNEYMGPDVYKAYAEDGTCAWTFGDGLSCTDPAMLDASTTEKGKRWKELGAGCAWRAMAVAWEDVRESAGTTFTDFASDFFAGPTPFTCNKVSGCDKGTIDCPTALEDDSGPGAQVILESFVRLSEILTTLYDAIGDALASVDSVLDNFIDDFAQPPEEEDPRVFNMVIDVIGMGFTLFMAPVFNNVMKLGPKAKDNVKDEAYGLTSWGLSLAKDAQKPDELQDKISLQISEELKGWIVSWQDATVQVIKEIFSGDPDTMDELFTLIEGGTLATGKTDAAQRKRGELLEVDKLQAQVEKAAWAQIVPRAWSLAGWRAVVVDGGKCDDVGAIDGYITSGTGDDTDVCHDGRRYYLVAAPKPWKKGTPDCFNESPPQNGSPPPCWDEGEDPRLKKLPGNDKLGDVMYGKLSLDDVVIGSVETWRNNDKKNGAGALDYDDRSQADKLIKDDDDDSDPVNVRAPGIFRIPVCSVKEAYETWQKKGGDWPSEPKDLPENFPCA